MPRRTRRSVLAAVGASFAAAGCLSALDDATGGTRTEKTTPGGTTAGTSTGSTADPTTTGRTTTGDWIQQAANSPDPDHAITLRNEASEARTLRVAVVREATGATVFETTEEAAPGAEYALYNLRKADPDGVESFRICVELVGGGTATSETSTETDGGSGDPDSPRRDCATIDTSECYGSAHATLFDDGSVGIVYAIC